MAKNSEVVVVTNSAALGAVDLEPSNSVTSNTCNSVTSNTCNSVTSNTCTSETPDTTNQGKYN